MGNIHSWWLCALIALTWGCASSKTDTLLFQLDWTHESEFAGYYLAESQGFFQAQHLEVRIKEGPAGFDVPGSLARGEADVAVMGQAMFHAAYAQDPDYVALMALYQISPRVILTLKSSGLTAPRDLRGHSIAVVSQGWKDLIDKTLANAGVDPLQVRQVPMRPEDVDLFYQGQVDAWTGFATSEPVEARLRGKDVNLIYCEDFGAGGYEGLLVVRKSTLEVKRSLLRRFVRAVIQGWRVVIEDPGQAATTLHSRQSDKNLDFQLQAIKALVPLIDTGNQPFGWIQESRWKRILGPDYHEADPGYSLEFLGGKN